MASNLLSTSTYELLFVVSYFATSIALKYYVRQT